MTVNVNTGSLEILPEQKVWTEFVYADHLTDDEVQRWIARRTVGQLVIAAQPTFKMHAGDLCFDYEWLIKHAHPADGPEVTPIWWAWDDCGTAIGTERDYVAGWRKSGLYKISIPQPVKGRIDIIISREEY